MINECLVSNECKVHSEDKWIVSQIQCRVQQIERAIFIRLTLYSYTSSVTGRDEQNVVMINDNDSDCYQSRLQIGAINKKVILLGLLITFNLIVTIANEIFLMNFILIWLIIATVIEIVNHDFLPLFVFGLNS